MSLFILLNSFIHLAGVRLMTFLFNHLINIPLALLLGLGKYFAFGIAVAMDITQIVLYYSVLNNTRLGRRFGWAINKKLFKSYRKPAFISRFHDNWIYLGVGILSLLPIYFGGMFAAVFTAHLLHLNRTKSFIVIFAASIIGCYIWTVGLWTAAALVISLVRGH